MLAPRCALRGLRWLPRNPPIKYSGNDDEEPEDEDLQEQRPDNELLSEVLLIDIVARLHLCTNALYREREDVADDEKLCKQGDADGRKMCGV